VTAAVPELGPLLGRFSAAEPRGPAVLPLDDLRDDLLSALFAKRAAAVREVEAGQPAAARTQLSREVWLEAFRTAAAATARRCLADVDRRFAAAAAESLIPARTLERWLPAPGDREVVFTRCESAGIPLEEVTPPESAADWEEGLLRTAMALDDSWRRLEAVVEQELVVWDREIASVRAWRRPRAPLWVLSVALVTAAVALGLSLGGYLPAPGPLAALRTWFWSLPWP
jgi:hypothetical protein